MSKNKAERRIFKTREELTEYLEDSGNGNVLVFKNPDYITAFIGLTGEQAVYDFDSMAESLMNEDKMTLSEAIEFIEYNTIRALPYYDKPPVIIHTVLGDEYGY